MSKGDVFALPNGGWILGNTIDGTQAEYVRTPHAVTSLYRLPPDADEEAVLLKLVQSGKLQPAKLVTHRFALDDIMKAYDTFGNAAKERALKVILTNPVKP